jgi:hypothetical protein
MPTELSRLHDKWTRFLMRLNRKILMLLDMRCLPSSNLLRFRDICCFYFHGMRVKPAILRVPVSHWSICYFLCISVLFSSTSCLSYSLMLIEWACLACNSVNRQSNSACIRELQARSQCASERSCDRPSRHRFRWSSSAFKEILRWYQISK